MFPPATIDAVVTREVSKKKQPRCFTGPETYTDSGASLHIDPYATYVLGVFGVDFQGCDCL